MTCFLAAMEQDDFAAPLGLRFAAMRESQPERLASNRKVRKMQETSAQRYAAMKAAQA